MGKIGLVTSASVPEETSIDITVFEDTEGDGSPNNSTTKSIHDGLNKYALTGFDAGRGNQYWWKVELDTENLEKGPVLGGVGLELIPGSETGTGVEPASVKSKLKEAQFFFEKLSKATNEEELRYYLSGYLSSIYSVDEILRDVYEFQSWSDKKCELELHEYLIEKRHDSIHLGRSTYGSLQPQVDDRIAEDVSFEVDEETSSKQSLIEDKHLSRVPKSVWLEYKSDEAIRRINIGGSFEEISEVERWRSLPMDNVVRNHLNLVSSWIDDWLRTKEGK
jgi:hypothetical protein